MSEVSTDIVARLEAASMHHRWPDEYPRSLTDEAIAEIRRLRGADSYTEPELRSMATLLGELQKYAPAEQRRIMWWLEKRLAAGLQQSKRAGSLREAASESDVAVLEKDHAESGDVRIETDGKKVRVSAKRGECELAGIELPKRDFDDALTAYFAPQRVERETV